MPLLKNAKKKLKQDKKRTIQNRKIKDTYKTLVKAAKTKKSADSVSKAFAGLDKAAKQNIIHPNKASRIKSAIARAIAAPAKSA